MSLNFRGRAAHARDWDGESGYRLHISPLSPRTSRRDVEKIFSKFGPMNEVNRKAFQSDSSLNTVFYNMISKIGLDGNESTVLCFC